MPKSESATDNTSFTKDQGAPSTAIDALPVKKEAPPETASAARLRYLVIFSFWAIIILLGLPIWWKTTAIYRASLPLDQMMDWADGRVRLSCERCV
jgi:phosphatidylinositol glycan class S